MNVNMILSDKMATRFAQDADVFEKFKVIAKPLLEAKVVEDFGPTHVQKIKEECDKGDYGLVAIYSQDKVYYRDSNIKVISNGQRWQVLDELLPKQKEI